MVLAAESFTFYTTFSKIEGVFVLLLTIAGAIAVLFRVRKNGLLSTLAAVAGLACFALATSYWLLQSFDVITGSNEYTWAAGQVVYDLGILLVIAALVLPKVGGGDAKPPVPPVAAWPGAAVPPQGQPGQPYAQPYSQPGQPAQPYPQPYSQPGQPAQPYAQPGQPAQSYGQPPAYGAYPSAAPTSGTPTSGSPVSGSPTSAAPTSPPSAWPQQPPQ
ncbi:MAG: hypothetical protein HOV77_17470 [Hamadaea sp.]|uniref:hypothetical protein n=1 Tax=Hamadaea sp. TaxID=2024425 RepID=UPI0018216657|nr:hypothetical protein [Hamadaea sp.]NUT20973.1 hypothetical protein [Hamadaea sp.]